eukprot:COSAG01_NODE_26_length_36857_cov_31.426166_23_plen_140_part_00
MSHGRASRVRAALMRCRCRYRGFSNVGYNNGPNPEPRTPHIDALHHSGAELTNYYVYRFCSPTRSSFMSGRLPFHVNQQNHPPASPGGGVPLGMTTLADKLNASGYLSHQIGKVSGRRRPLHCWLAQHETPLALLDGTA